MRLVEDDRVVLGQDAPARGEIGEVESVICDHEVGLACPCAGGLGEAGRDEGTAAAGAAVGTDGELGPQRIGGLQRQLGAVAGLGRGEPRLQRLVGRLVARVAQQHRAEAVELLAAEVVLASLEHGDAELPAERTCRSGYLVGE